MKPKQPSVRIIISVLALLACLLVALLGVHSTHSAAGVAAAWPQPVEETYQGCPPTGDGGDTQLNLRKNRIDVAPWRSTTVASLLALPWPRTVDREARANWAPADAAAVGQQEGRPVTVEGYLLFLRHEGPESTNCHDPKARDYHAWLAASPGTLGDRKHAVVVELTPRVVAMNHGWGSQAAILRLRGQHVRISGWLMLDQEHPEQLGKTRGTLWEIHPVMQIAIMRGGRWIDLATGKPASSAAVPSSSPAPAAPTSTATKPAAGTLSVQVSVSPNPTLDGTLTTVSAITAPGATCSVRVVYASGSPSGSAGLKTVQTAGSSGMVSWSWKPATRRPGPATATVTCSLAENTVTDTAQFTVT